MHLLHLTTCVPDVTDTRGTWSGWFLHDGEHLVDATMNVVRVWNWRSEQVVKKVLPFLEQLHSVRGHLIFLRKADLVISAHTDPQNTASELYVRDPLTLKRRRRILDAPGAVHALSVEAEGQGFAVAITQSKDPPEGRIVGYDASLEKQFELDHAAPGQILWIRKRNLLLETLCEYDEPGVELYHAESGYLSTRLAENAPVTHLLHAHGDDLWMFQDGGQLEIWDLETETRKRAVKLRHERSRREDFKHGTVVSFDIGKHDAFTLGTDRMVRVWDLRTWDLKTELQLAVDGTWVDFDEAFGLVAVGTTKDRIELYTLSS